MPDERPYRKGVHPPGCSCVTCTEARLKLFRRNRAFPRSVIRAAAVGLRAAFPVVVGLLKGLVIIAVVVALMSYLFFTAVHLTNGFHFGESFEMGFRDFRLAATCPTKPKTVWRFVKRTELDSLAIGFAEAMGGDIYQEVCQGGLDIRY